MFARIKSFKLPEAAAIPKLVFQQLISRLIVLRDQLSIAQKFYLLAILLLIFKQPLALVALVSLLAILLEFWPIFEKVWHSLAGKAVLLLFYAIIANFALANASAVVNDVVGVPAQHFNYTHNFAILLYIPAWFIIISGIVMFLVQIMSPAYFLFIWILRPLGIKSPQFIHHSTFRRSTFLVRVMLSFVVIYHLWMLLGVDLESNIEDPNSPVSQVLNQQDVNMREDILDQLEQPLAKENDNLSTTDDKQLEGMNLNINIFQEIDFKQVHHNYSLGVRKAVALFAYTFEADNLSRCEKSADSHVVELNDYEILAITRNSSAVYDYDFVIKPCVSVAFGRMLPKPVNQVE
ncbi:hypothetical protein [Shewanella glacialimarina]|uniref:hypothetical protein n=1 Tax=Shewanella glacialimarina TaxID=2590884 RepID=UPI001CF85440|nr:hypothetical protein [Shewanella glacialimarina]UCX06414.1 hypothetical protein FJ709_19050 [Shewanella glacialimarina]